MTKEKPILFNANEVQATLEKRKTQFRQVVKPREMELFKAAILLGECSNFLDNPKHPWDDKYLTGLCPYGIPGDVLWVRETFALCQTINYIRKQSGASFSEVSDGFAEYRADGHESIDDLKEHIRLMSGSSFEGVEVDGDKWKPSVHMPRWASRIQLRIANVRVEQAQDKNCWMWVIDGDCC